MSLEASSRLEGIHDRPPPPPQDLNDLAAGPKALRTEAEEVAELRRLRRRAREELWELLRIPDARRRERIRCARRRFRSRLLAEMLIEECRSLAPSAPAESQEIAALVPLVLAWADRAEGPAWAQSLLALAAGLRAEALPSAGDLVGAEAALLSRCRLAERRLHDDGFLASVTSRVEALCDLQRFSEARRVVDDHLDDFEASGDVRAGALLRYLEGRIHLGLGRHEIAAEFFATAREGLLALGLAAEAASVAIREGEAYRRAGLSEHLQRLSVRLGRTPR